MYICVASYPEDSITSFPSLGSTPLIQTKEKYRTCIDCTPEYKSTADRYLITNHKNIIGINKLRIRNENKQKYSTYDKRKVTKVN